MKDCIECGVRKEFDAYWKNAASNDGYCSKCIDCMKAYLAKRKEAKDKLMPPGWKQKTKDMTAYRHEWAKKNPGYATRKKKEWWDRNKDRLAIKDKVRYAVRTGKLIKLPCIVCGSLEVEAHHPDYSKPLDVIWLCKTHHHEVHK